MGKIVSGMFNGTGATVYVGIGFVPDYVKICGMSANSPSIEWNRNMRPLANIEGYLDTNGATALAVKAIGAGVAPYYGGDLMTSTNQTSVANGEGVYLWWDRKDYRNSSTATVNPGDAVGAEAISKFIMDTPANRTGHFNADVVGTYIGAGSKIIIGGREYIITVLTAGQGVSADEVTLSSTLASAPAVMSGLVGAITNKNDLIPIPIGKVSTAGFAINTGTLVNVNDEKQYFIAGTFDA